MEKHYPLLLLLLLLNPLTASSSTPLDSSSAARVLFARFKRQYRRAYATLAEEAHRFEVFQDTLAHVAARNAARSGRDAAVHGVTQFADMTPREFRLMSRRTRPSSTNLHSYGGSYPTPYVPPEPVSCSRNWATNFPSVSSIRDQEACGGCWAYAQVETMRMQFVARHGIENDPGMLSAEYLLDCAAPAWSHQNCSCWSWGNEKTCFDGCCGGDGVVAANWMAAVGGVPTAEAYGGRGHFDKNVTYNVTQSANDPFTAWPCNRSVSKAIRPVGPPIFFAPGKTLNLTVEIIREEQAAAAKGGRKAVEKLFCEKYGICPDANGKYVSPESAVADYVCEVGPVEIGVSDDDWSTYTGGVLTASDCSNTTQSHSVEIVGLDADKQAWIVRNHWGPKWGVSPIPPYLPASQTPGGNGGGYVLLAFGENTCRMAEAGFAHPQLERAN